MHMADALISPAAGGTMWAASLGVAAYSAKKLKGAMDEVKAPLMGVLAAFVFSAQMINFTIPMTGSSGHLGGGMLLAILLGPHAAFLAIFSVLAVQALFFADGGLLALGCNVFNLGFFPSFIAYPLIYRKIAGQKPTQGRLVAGSVAASIVGLQLGAFGVVVETTLSGISELPFGTFVLLMQPIHLAIGIVEGIVTAAVVSFVWKARPEILDMAAGVKPSGKTSARPVLIGLAAVAVITGGILSWFASSYPDGLEWSMFRVSGKEELEAPEDGVHALAARIQEKTAFLPDYDFKEKDGSDKRDAVVQEAAGGREKGAAPAKEEGSKKEEAEKWPAVSAGTSLAGIVGAAITLLAAGLTALLLRFSARSSSS